MRQEASEVQEAKEGEIPTKEPRIEQECDKAQAFLGGRASGLMGRWQPDKPWELVSRQAHVPRGEGDLHRAVEWVPKSEHAECRQTKKSHKMQDSLGGDF